MWFLRRTIPVVDVAVLLVVFSFIPSLSAMEPLKVSTDFVRDEQAVEMPVKIWSNLENRITGIVHSLGRFDVGSSTDVPAPTHELRFRVVSYRENRIPGTDGMLEMEARMVLEAGVFERSSETPIRMFTFTVERSADTRDALHETFIDNSVTDLESEIRRLYVLAGMSRPAGRYRAVVDIGEDLGLEHGGMLLIDSHDGHAGRESGTFLRVEETFPHHSNTRIVRQWGTREAGGIARELVDHVTEFRIVGGVDLPPAGARRGSKSRVPTATTSFQFVVNPYAPFFFGGGIRAFLLYDSQDLLDPGVGIQGFVGHHLLRTPRARVALLSALHLDTVHRTDSQSRPVSAFIPGISVALESSMVVAARWDAVVAAGYRLSPTVNDWMIVDETSIDDSSARFTNGRPSVNTSGVTLVVGVRFVDF